MKSSNTPGPWGVQKDPNKPFRVISKNTKASKYWICELVSENKLFESKREQANAFLLSAAPCLLEACRMSLEHFLVGNEDEIETLVMVLKKAIEKAKPSQS